MSNWYICKVELNLQPASTQQISTIVNLANQIWHQHYPSIISIEQINYMLGKMYGEESLKEQFSKGHLFYLIHFKKETIGFISVEKSTERTIHLHKFYILQKEGRKGIGSASFSLLLKELKGVEEIRLTVNRQNYKAINFYFKNNFIIEKVADFDIGNGYQMNDFIMLWRAATQFQ